MPILASDFNKGFQAKVAEIGDDDFRRCMQCGQCTGMCPMTDQVDVTPRQVMHLLQLGQADALASLKMYWACAACHNCMVNCPRDIDIPRVMECLRLLVLRENRDYVDVNAAGPEKAAEMPQIAFVSGFRKLTA